MLFAAGCSSASEPDREKSSAPESASVVASSYPGVRVVAVGDIACEPGEAVTSRRCRHEATADRAKALRPDLVLTLGDHQYDKNTLSGFAGSYNKSWGSLLSKTRPAPGNHEYKTPNASGYYTYFADRQPGPPGYYRVRTADWNVYVLNSNCTRIDCVAQAEWLDTQMSENPSSCSLITMHHPRYSSGREHGDNPAVTPLWEVAYKHGNDIVLSGHDHDYERFYPMNANGGVRRSRGMRQFVVGTGGKSLYHLGTRRYGSRYYQARTAGVLFLGLESGAFRWSFHTTAGRVLDAGRANCH